MLTKGNDKQRATRRQWKRQSISGGGGAAAITSASKLGIRVQEEPHDVCLHPALTATAIQPGHSDNDRAISAAVFSFSEAADT